MSFGRWIRQKPINYYKISSRNMIRLHTWNKDAIGAQLLRRHGFLPCSGPDSGIIIDELWQCQIFLGACLGRNEFRLTSV